MLTIGNLAKACGATTVTIRYYEKIGLIQSTRGSNGYRMYMPEMCKKMQFIENAKSVGLSLEEIKALFVLEKRSKSSQDVKKTIVQKRSAVTQKIALLKKIEKTLISWERACDGKVSIENCPILENLYDSDLKKGARDES
ncbi:MerR family transcriptional regulator [Fangia hongkongensis]|uniref:MerR family transcriptional regulator n=1 Tax=Fangia hongkongensis TaxID=270495 RepID=UPI00037EBAEE|nr:MerR family transcriptional regulator [Fangia hongkongensis]MBK2125124.1 MerR family transcriptional regulator [Fangia hongkongensis]